LRNLIQYAGTGTRKSLDGLMSDTGASDPDELISAALALFKWAAEQKRDGNVVAAVNEARLVYREVRMPQLEGRGPSTPAELVASAVALLRWAVGERIEGNAIASVDEARMVCREVRSPFLDGLAPSPWSATPV